MSDQPNLIIITTHDTGRHFGCYGVPTVQSPHIDALAAEGCRLTNLFSTSPVSSPSRGSLLTGRYPQRNGLMGLAGGIWNWELTDPSQHLSHVLRRAGYRTRLFGDHHEADGESTLGWEQVDAYLQPKEERHKARTALQVAQGVAEFLRREGREPRPFFAQVGFFETHTPYNHGGVEPDDSKGVTIPPYLVNNERARQHLAHLQGSVRRADEAVGIITAALRETGLEKDTLLVYTVDHGIEAPRAKWTLYDPGTAIAMILRWPGGGIGAGVACDWLLSNVDFMPTLARLINLPLPHEVDGVSFAEGLTGGGTTHDPPRDLVGSMFVHTEMRAVRTAGYKLIRNFHPGFRYKSPAAFGEAQERVPQAPVELYDLERDPLEFNNLAEDPAYTAARGEMDQRFWNWLEQVDDPLLRGLTPTPSYLAAMADYRPGRR